MNDQITATSLWKASLGSRAADQEVERKKERLRVALTLFRDRVSILTNRIAATFPELTIHDITHLDALWQTASLIAGEAYPLNPLEAFVFGGAVLLHDAAHCFEAYAGGRDAVRSTVEWRDCYASESGARPQQTHEELEHLSDFAAVRLLHAHQAERLGEHAWKRDADEGSFYLIEDSELRARYGALIGQIAASHHWSIEEVKSRLRAQVNAPGGWPAEWRVDPIKIACLLRCSDAAHLDNRRAPDFLFALMRRSGVSLNHWKAQNWLAQIDVDQSDPSGQALLFTSNHAFEPKDADAWWVAYDAITMLDAELRASNTLLLSRVQKDSSSPPLHMQRVTGANSPSVLSKLVETKGWIPTSAQIHVGNVERLVSTLGGQQLYGSADSFAIVIRELMQNARDAVVARRSISHEFEGRIQFVVTSLSPTRSSVEIRDDGVGMSERTMTTALLDFGTSFWASDLVRSEFPGLRSSPFKPVGQFGIGFYSVFMVAAELAISSRRFDEGLSDLTTLRFPNGLTLRPLLSKGLEDGFNASASTCVRLIINEPIDHIINRLINSGQPENEWRLPLANYLAAISAGLDVSVSLQIDNGAPVEVHQRADRLDTSKAILAWLKRLTFVDTARLATHTETLNYVTNNAGRLRRIEYAGRLVGLAALLDQPGRASQYFTTDTIGGLTSNVSRGAGAYLGFIDNAPTSARRDSTKRIAPPEILQSWGDDQLSILRGQGASREQLYWAASNLCNLELDPINGIYFPVFASSGNSLMDFEELFALLQKTPIALLKARNTQFAETNLPPTIFDGLPTLRPLSPGNLIRLELADGKPKYPHSLLGCLHRLVQGKGCDLVYEEKPLPLQTIFGPMDAFFVKLKA